MTCRRLLFASFYVCYGVLQKMFGIQHEDTNSIASVVHWWRNIEARPWLWSVLWMLQCFDSVGWVMGRAAGPWKTESLTGIMLTTSVMVSIMHLSVVHPSVCLFSHGLTAQHQHSSTSYRALVQHAVSVCLERAIWAWYTRSHRLFCNEWR